MEGNCGATIDPQGFLSIPDSHHIDVGKVNPIMRKINGLKPISYSLYYNKGEYVEEINRVRNRDVCWICEGWQEREF